MIKLENNMLVLDATFSKEDVRLINEFVLLAEQRTEQRIVKMLEPLTICEETCDHYNCGTWALKEGIALIKGEN